jgi:hypothetical protein
MPRIQVTAFLDIGPDEYDDGPLGPLNADTHEQIATILVSAGLDDVSFELASEEG